MDCVTICLEMLFSVSPDYLITYSEHLVESTFPFRLVAAFRHYLHRIKTCASTAEVFHVQHVGSRWFWNEEVRHPQHVSIDVVGVLFEQTEEKVHHVLRISSATYKRDVADFKIIFFRAESQLLVLLHSAPQLQVNGSCADREVDEEAVAS